MGLPGPPYRGRAPAGARGVKTVSTVDPGTHRLRLWVPDNGAATRSPATQSPLRAVSRLDTDGVTATTGPTTTGTTPGLPASAVGLVAR